MKRKKEYAILAVLVIVLGLYLFFRDTDRTTYTLPQLAPISAPDITRIEIVRDAGGVELARSDSGWRVSPGDYPADAGRVNRMLNALADLDVTVLVSETRNYERYELDEAHRIGVTTYQDGAIVRAFRIGKVADTMRHTHVTLSEDPNVYHARGNFRSDFDQTVDDLRDKTVLAFDIDAVTSFAIETGDRTVSLRKIDAASPGEGADASSTPAPKEAAVQWQTEDGRHVEKASVETILASLSGLKCRGFLTDRSRDGLTDPTHRILIEVGESLRLDIFAPADASATEMPATSSQQEDPFTLADFDIDPVKDFLAELPAGEAPLTP